MRRKTTLASVAIAGVATLGLGIPALAQSGAPDLTPESSTSAKPDFEERKAEHRAELAERLAEELGLDADEVAEALETVMTELREEHQAERLAALEERLTEAVEAGRLTQAQADAILEAAKSGDLHPRLHRLHRGLHGGGPGMGGAPDAGAESESGFAPDGI
jgi:nucleotide-binding universal stress UspA family protein